MNWQVENRNRKKFTGNVTLYSETRIGRSPVFLQRSLRAVLWYHKQILKKRSKDREFDRKMDSIMPGSDRMSPERNTRDFWSLKELEASELGTQLGSQGPTLRIELKGIRDKRERRPLSNGEPANKRSKLFHTRAQCALTIWESRSSKQEIVVKQIRLCSITTDSSCPESRLASISMDEPFLVRVDELSLAPTSGRPANGITGTPYLMQILLSSNNSDDSWPPVPMKLRAPQFQYVKNDQGETERFPMFLAKWVKLPECPESGTLLNLFAQQDYKSYKTKLMLELNAAWRVASSSLSVHNRRRKVAYPPKAHLPSPTSELGVPQSIISVTWAFAEAERGLSLDTLHHEDYVCVMCNKLKLGNLDALHFHLINSHDLFKFMLNCKATTTAAKQSKIEVNIVVNVADDYRERAANDVPDDREMMWRRPMTLFDLEGFLKGDETWLGKQPRRSRLQNVSRFHEYPRSESRDSVRNENPVVGLRAPQAVPNLAAPDRRKHKVPPSLGQVRFFRSATKRPLEEGEWISESDDEIDEGWLMQKHAQIIGSFTDMTLAEKGYIQRYDHHMLREDLSSNLHHAEALVRFCRLNRSWLGRNDMSLEFQKHAANMILHGIIDHVLLLACMKIIQESTDVEEENETEISTIHHVQDINSGQVVKSDPKSEKNGLGQGWLSPSFTRKSSKQAAHHLGTCSCHGSIDDMRKSITCSNVVSIPSKLYEFNCVLIETLRTV